MQSVACRLHSNLIYACFLLSVMSESRTGSSAGFAAPDPRLGLWVAVPVMEDVANASRPNTATSRSCLVFFFSPSQLIWLYVRADIFVVPLDPILTCKYVFFCKRTGRLDFIWPTKALCETSVAHLGSCSRVLGQSRERNRQPVCNCV